VRKQDEMENMNMLLSARNAFIISIILIFSYMIYSMIKGEYKREIVIMFNIMFFSFTGSSTYYANKWQGKGFFRAILPVALIVLITALVILFVMWMLR